MWTTKTRQPEFLFWLLLLLLLLRFRFLSIEHHTFSRVLGRPVCEKTLLKIRDRFSGILL